MKYRSHHLHCAVADQLGNTLFFSNVYFFKYLKVTKKKKVFFMQKVPPSTNIRSSTLLLLGYIHTKSKPKNTLKKKEIYLKSTGVRQI